MKPIKVTNKYRTIKRELCELSKTDKEYLLNNMKYRHNLYNKGIELIRLAKTEFPDQYISKYDIANWLHHRYELLRSDYDYYCTSIRNIVSRDLFMMMEKSYSNTLTYNSIEKRFKFKKFNPNYMSFGFECKPQLRHYGQMTSKVKGMTNNTISILMNKNRLMKFHIKENSWFNKKYKYVFNMYDIKEIVFTYIGGKFYIMLICAVQFIHSYVYNDNRITLAGIDLGERNPVMVYDKVNGYTNIQFPVDSIRRINLRIARYRKILTRKKESSNNYARIETRISKLYRRAYNIRLDWRNKVAFNIVNKYKFIVVDNFKVPIIRKNDGEIIPTIRRNMNRSMTTKGMSYFIDTLRDMADKYYCGYIVANPDTTRTCSKCGFINEHLPLRQKYLHCVHCGSIIHRDKNAALNCYNQFKPYIITI